MFQTNTNDQSGDSDGSTLRAGLLVTASTTTANISSSKKYAQLWQRTIRRSITVGVFISLKRPSFPEGHLLSSPTSSSPLLTQDKDSNSIQKESSDNHNHGHENGFIKRVPRASKSFKEQGNSATCYDPVPAPPVEQALDRNFSTQSGPAIDIAIAIPSDNENEEEKREVQKLRDTVVRIVKERDLNLLEEFGGVKKVVQIFDSDSVKGKSFSDDVQEPHIWDKAIQPKRFFYYLLKAGNNFNIFFLVVAAALSFSTGIMEQGARDGWHDGVATVAAVFMLLIFPAVSNFRRARKLEKKLWKEKNKLEVKVVRNGKKHSITISLLVEGDIVSLTKGDRVPADGLVVKSDGLVLDDVLNSQIECKRNPFLFSGSKVTDGLGSMIVTSVGTNTALGNMLSLAIPDPDKKTLLEAQTEKPNSYMENLSVSVSVLIALVALVRLVCRKHNGDDNGFPELKGNVTVDMVMKMVGRILFKTQGKIRILVSALTVVVIAIQHGMPFAITISLSFWKGKMEINQAKSQNLSACAIMGIVTVFCIDTTGGLVSNEEEVNKFWIGEKDVNNDGDSEIDQAVLQNLERASILVPEISVVPTNDWLASWANKSLNAKFLDGKFSILKYRKLNPRKKVCGILVKNNDVDDEQIMHMHWSGAASEILDMCSHYYDCKGRSHAIEDEKINFPELIQDMENSGLRPIAFACSKTEVQEIKEEGLHLLALAGLRYPCSEEIKSTVGALRKAGVRIILVSEDELSAVRAIACGLGIWKPESNEVDQMDFMGSRLAEDKLLLVKSLQENDQVVAFLGGSSTRDTLALKNADVGITLEDRCTETASLSSDIVISTKGSISLIVEFGRCAYKNIQKFTQLQLTVCISGLLITLVTTLSLEESPITTLQLIWTNWIVCILGGVMMIMEFKDQETISNPQSKRTKSVINRLMWKHITIQVLSQAFVLLIFQFKGQFMPSMNKDIRKTMIFSSFTLCQVFNQFNTMSVVKKDVLSVVLRNYTFLVALVIVLAMQVLVVEFANSLADYQKLNGMQWGVCFILGALTWGIHCAAGFISDSLSNWSSWCDGLRLDSSMRRHWGNFSFLILGIPFSMSLYSSLSYYSPHFSFTSR